MCQNQTSSSLSLCYAEAGGKAAGIQARISHGAGAVPLLLGTEGGTMCLCKVGTKPEEEICLRVVPAGSKGCLPPEAAVYNLLQASKCQAPCGFQPPRSYASSRAWMGKKGGWSMKLHRHRLHRHHVFSSGNGFRHTE